MKRRRSDGASVASGGRISRRGVLGVVAAAGVVALSSSQAEAIQAPTSGVLLGARDLLAPLEDGAKLGVWTVVKMHEGQQGGAMVVELADADGKHFQVDICRRDEAADAPVPPAHTGRCDLFIANGGQGTRMTDESHGLAAMALAEIVKTNEHRVDLSTLSTQRQRLLSRRGEVVRHV